MSMKTRTRTKTLMVFGPSPAEASKASRSLAAHYDAGWGLEGPPAKKTDDAPEGAYIAKLSRPAVYP
jgi:hypothetical protein